MKLLLLMMFFMMVPAEACTWAIGYFHQVTHLRGTVVGVNSNRDLRGLFRWSRRMVARDNTELKLYEYREPVSNLSERGLVRQVITDARGYFDFGHLPTGHYSLHVGSEVFDIQLAKLARATRSVVIDISPVAPNCQGGHEFEVTVE